MNRAALRTGRVSQRAQLCNMDSAFLRRVKKQKEVDCLMLGILTYLSMVCSDASLQLQLAETQHFISKIRLL